MSEQEDIKNCIKKPKKHKPRCQFYDIPNKCKCKRKLNLIQLNTNKCKCNKLFCNNHRLPSDHCCEFDFTIKDMVMYEKTHGLGGGIFTKVEII